MLPNYITLDSAQKIMSFVEIYWCASFIIVGLS